MEKEANAEEKSRITTSESSNEISWSIKFQIRSKRSSDAELRECNYTKTRTRHDDNDSQVPALFTTDILLVYSTNEYSALAVVFFVISRGEETAIHISITIRMTVVMLRRICEIKTAPHQWLVKYSGVFARADRRIYEHTTAHFPAPPSF